MNKKIIAISVLIAILFVSAITGTIVYYNVVVNQKDSQIANQNNEIANLNRQISNLTAQVGNLINMTRAKENLICTNSDIVSAYKPSSDFSWTITLTLENSGNATAIINNIILNGQSYGSYNPTPTINPSIQNGYALSPSQSVTITIQDTNSSTGLGANHGVQAYVLTAIGNSYSIYIGS